MRLDWKIEAGSFLLKKRVVAAALAIAVVAGAFRFSYRPEEASAVAVAYFVSSILGVWMGARVWLMLDKLLSREFRSLRDRLASVEDRLGQFMTASGKDPQRYGAGTRRQSWSQRAEICLFSLAVKSSPVGLLMASQNFLLAYVEWRTGVLSMNTDFTAFYFYVGCLMATIFVWGTLHQWFSILNARKTVGALESMLDGLESGTPMTVMVTDRKPQEVYEKKLGFYEQIERLVYQWIGVRVPV